MPKKLIIILAIALTLLSPVKAQSNKETSNTCRVDTTNYILGTQTIGIKYKFTEKTGLVETAERIHEMGSNLLKFSMSRRYKSDQYNLPEKQSIRSLADLAQKEPSIKTVLDMPFAYYHIWAYPFAHADSTWLDGLSEEEKNQTYEEMRELARYLLETYNGTGKTFLLGHWEGDWHLHRNYNPKLDPAPEAIRGMIDWLNIRQKAIDDAKRETKCQDVELYHYTEANLVQKAMRGETCLVNDVLPHTNVDYVSYSSYDTIAGRQGEAGPALRKALDYIESKLPPKPTFLGKRVFIGEYGFPLELAKTPENQDLYSRDVCRAALEWGCPFVLYWEMYCNENPKGKHRGFWLIDDKNRKQPFYHTLRDYYGDMKRYVAEFKKENGRPPTESEMQKKAVENFEPSSK